jgi:hypothetical protein
MHAHPSIELFSQDLPWWLASGQRSNWKESVHRRAPCTAQFYPASVALPDSSARAASSNSWVVIVESDPAVPARK